MRLKGRVLAGVVVSILGWMRGNMGLDDSDRVSSVFSTFSFSLCLLC